MNIPAYVEAGLSKAEKQDTRLYHPEHDKFTGGIIQTVFLQQCQFRWINNGHDEFYKFTEPCDHPYYRDGDSWCEELGIKKTAFYEMKNRLGKKLLTSKGEHWITEFEKANEKFVASGDPNDLLYLCWYTNRSDNRTYYAFNVEAYLYMRIMAYSSVDPVLKNWLGKLTPQNGVRSEELTPRNGVTNSAKRSPYKTETTAETTKERKKERARTLSTANVRNKSTLDAVMDEPKRIPMDEWGNIEDETFDPNEPFLMKITSTLKVLRRDKIPRSLQKEWIKLRDRARDEPEFKQWMEWQAVNNAKDKGFRVYLGFVDSEVDFYRWLEGDFVSTDVLSKNGRQPSVTEPEPESSNIPVMRYDENGNWIKPEFNVDNI